MLPIRDLKPGDLMNLGGVLYVLQIQELSSHAATPLEAVFVRADCEGVRDEGTAISRQWIVVSEQCRLPGISSSRRIVPYELSYCKQKNRYIVYTKRIYLPWEGCS